jgi:MoaA/NifB/PqqE/SkfB family radical SAM enzyme
MIEHPLSQTPRISPTLGAGVISHPIINIALFLTQTCNLRCVYCHGQGGIHA